LTTRPPHWADMNPMLFPIAIGTPKLPRQNTLKQVHFLLQEEPHNADMNQRCSG
jgi:hypothetical protein